MDRHMNRGPRLVRIAGLTLLGYGILSAVSAAQMIGAALAYHGSGLVGTAGAFMAVYAAICLGLAIAIIAGFDGLPLLSGLLVTMTTSGWLLAISKRPSLEAAATILVTVVLLVGVIARWTARSGGSRS